VHPGRHRALSRGAQPRLHRRADPPQHGTVGGNLCLDTRCLFYNQSEWVAAPPKTIASRKQATSATSRPRPRRLLATFRGDLAPGPADAWRQVNLAGRRASARRRSRASISATRSPLPNPPPHSASQHARKRADAGEEGEGKRNPGCGQIYLRCVPGNSCRGEAKSTPGLRSHDKIRIRRSIDSRDRRRRGAQRAATRSSICASPSPAPTAAGAPRRHV